MGRRLPPRGAGARVARFLVKKLSFGRFSGRPYGGVLYLDCTSSRGHSTNTKNPTSCKPGAQTWSHTSDRAFSMPSVDIPRMRGTQPPAANLTPRPRRLKFPEIKGCTSATGHPPCRLSALQPRGGANPVPRPGRTPATRHFPCRLLIFHECEAPTPLPQT